MGSDPLSNRPFIKSPNPFDKASPAPTVPQPVPTHSPAPARPMHSRDQLLRTALIPWVAALAVLVGWSAVAGKPLVAGKRLSGGVAIAETGGGDAETGDQPGQLTALPGGSGCDFRDPLRPCALLLVETGWRTGPRDPFWSVLRSRAPPMAWVV